MSLIRDDARFACEVAVKIRCPSWSDYLNLYATNISKGGVFVASKLSAPVGEEVSVDLALPTGAVVRLLAQVVHHDGPVNGMGLMFLEMEKETREALEAMLTVARFTLKSAGELPAEAEKKAPPQPSAAPAASPGGPAFADVVEQTLLNELSRRMDLGPHEQLGVEAGASSDEIDSAFFRLCERYHPVSFERYSEETQALVQKLNELLHAAYDQLSGAEELQEVSQPPPIPKPKGWVVD
jgi:uncharacterized protein (TIGR02266 family)